jgi:hypothetical protein
MSKIKAAGSTLRPLHDVASRAEPDIYIGIWAS